VPAGGVADDGHVVEVEPAGDRQLRQGVDRRGHVGERGGPPATGADPPVFDGDGGPAGRPEVRGQRAGQLHAVGGPPEAPVEHDGHGRPAVAAGGQGQLQELVGVRAVPVHQVRTP
jgi:hypothetical protein